MYFSCLLYSLVVDVAVDGSTSFVSSDPIPLRQWTHVIISQSVHKLRSSSVSMYISLEFYYCHFKKTVFKFLFFFSIRFINGKQIQSNVANKTPLIEKKSKWLLGHAPDIMFVF